MSVQEEAREWLEKKERLYKYMEESGERPLYSPEFDLIRRLYNALVALEEELP